MENVELTTEDGEEVYSGAGALVPVRDGERCLLDALDRHHFVLRDGSVWVYGKLACELVRITDNFRVSVREEFCKDVKFQPVRLVQVGDLVLGPQARLEAAAALLISQGWSLTPPGA